jgi:RNA polymerase sigma factor (sigma-70 family)
MRAEQDRQPESPRYGDDSLRLIQAYLHFRREGRVPHPRLRSQWEHFYRLQSMAVRHFARSFGLNNHEIDDLQQEVWTDVIVNIARLDPQSGAPGVRAWFYMVVRSKAINHLREKRRLPISITALLEQGVELAAPLPPSAALLERKWRQALAKAIHNELRRRLPELSYQVWKLRALQRRSVQEVARHLGLSRKTVRVRYSRACRKLVALRALRRALPDWAEHFEDSMETARDKTGDAPVM